VTVLAATRGLAEVARELDTTWVIVAGVLVMFMQAGFACVEIGFSRSKNVGTVIAKVLLNFSVATITWWLVGFSIAFGGGALIAGDSGFVLSIGHQISQGSPIAGPSTATAQPSRSSSSCSVPSPSPSSGAPRSSGFGSSPTRSTAWCSLRSSTHSWPTGSSVGGCSATSAGACRTSQVPRSCT